MIISNLRLANLSLGQRRERERVEEAHVILHGYFNKEHSKHLNMMIVFLLLLDILIQALTPI